MAFWSAPSVCSSCSRPTHVACDAGVTDSREAARTYLKHETGNHFDDAALDAFLDVGPRMGVIPRPGFEKN